MDLLADLDTFLGLRKNFTLARWINDAHRLAQSEWEKAYFDQNARTLVTVWGNINGDCSALYDYAWREWNGSSPNTTRCAGSGFTMKRSARCKRIARL